MKKKNTGKESRTDWKKLVAKADVEIDTSDVPELDKDFFRHAQVRMPEAKQMVSLRLDSDVLDWFKSQGKGYQTRVNAVLRAYVEGHKLKSLGKWERFQGWVASSVRNLVRRPRNYLTSLHMKHTVTSERLAP